MDFRRKRVGSQQAGDPRHGFQVSDAYRTRPYEQANPFGASSSHQVMHDTRGTDRRGPTRGTSLETSDNARRPRELQHADEADVMSPHDIIIAVMGITGSGKTTFISRCVGEDVGVGHGLESCTQDVAIHSLRRRGRTIRMIDTPGFDDTSKDDVEILKNITFWLSHAYRARPKLLVSAIIYLHPISETRVVGTSVRNLEMMKRLCGDGSLSAMWLATTMWGFVPSEVGQARERELINTPEFWGSLIRHGSRVRRHQNSDASAFAIIDDIIMRHQPVVLDIQRQMVDENKAIDETEAGRYLRRRVIEEQQRVQNRLGRSAEELDERLAEQNAAEVDEVLERQRRYQEQLQEKSRSIAAMKVDMEALRQQKAQELARREEEFVRERAAQEAKMEELNGQIRELQTQREKAIQQAEANAASNRQLEDANQRLAEERDRAAIAALDRAITQMENEEVQMEIKRRQVVKQESIFRKTLKVSLAETLIHGAWNVVTQACVVM